MQQFFFHIVMRSILFPSSNTLWLRSIVIWSPHLELLQWPLVKNTDARSDADETVSKIESEVEQMLFLMSVSRGAVTQQQSQPSWIVFMYVRAKNPKGMNKKCHTQPTPNSRELDFKKLLALWIKFVLYNFFFKLKWWARGYCWWCSAQYKTRPNQSSPELSVHCRRLVC